MESKVAEASSHRSNIRSTQLDRRGRHNMALPRTSLLLGLLLSVVLLIISSEVTARELAEDAQAKAVEEAKQYGGGYPGGGWRGGGGYPGGGGGYPGGGWRGGGGYPGGGGGYPGGGWRGGGGWGGGCHWGCCGRNYYGGCRCCNYPGQVPDADVVETQN